MQDYLPSRGFSTCKDYGPHQPSITPTHSHHESAFMCDSELRDCDFIAQITVLEFYNLNDGLMSEMGFNVGMLSPSKPWNRPLNVP